MEQELSELGAPAMPVAAMVQAIRRAVVVVVEEVAHRHSRTTEGR